MLEDCKEEYDITENGFVPFKCHNLPEEYQYLKKIKNNKEKYSNFREYIKKYKSGKLEKLENYKYDEIKTIYSLSSIIVHYYMWYDYFITNSDDNIKITIPYILSYPFYNSSKIIGIKPVLTHAGVNLWNWKFKDNNLGFELENLECKYIMCKDIEQTESWFFLIMTYLEYRCGKIIYNMDKIYNELKKDKNNKMDETIILLNIKIISGILDEQIKLINNIYKKCDPKEFYNRLRIFLNGSSKLKNGIKLLDINAINEINIKCKGASAAQSSIIPLEDIFFNIEHKQKNIKQFLEEMREYMPLKHRNLIIYFNKRPKLKDYFSKMGNTDIEKVYNECIIKLNKFRKCHLTIVKKYIFDQQNGMGGLGTGGTPLKSFLQNIIENTKIRSNSILRNILYYLNY